MPLAVRLLCESRLGAALPTRLRQRASPVPSSSIPTFERMLLLGAPATIEKLVAEPRASRLAHRRSQAKGPTLVRVGPFANPASETGAAKPPLQCPSSAPCP